MHVNYEALYNAYKAKEKISKISPVFIITQLEKITDQLVNTLDVTSVIKPSLFKNILSRDQLYMFSLLSEVSISSLASSSTLKPEGLNMLSPFGMYFFKKNYNINYEQWDKEDSALSKMMPHRLYTYLMSDSTVFDPNDILEVRQSLDEPFDKYPKKSIKDHTPRPVMQYDPGRHIELQTYLAHVSNRNKYMILDKTNWDLMPKALDAQLVKEEVTPLSSLPW